MVCWSLSRRARKEAEDGQHQNREKGAVKQKDEEELQRRKEIATRTWKDGDVGDTGNKEGNDKDRVKKAEKNDKKEEEVYSNSDTISINSDFLYADEMEVEICWI